MQRFLSFGYLALVAGGLLISAGSLLSLTLAGDPFSVQVATGTFAMSAAMRLVGAMGVIIGLTAVYVRESDAAGRLGLGAYVLVIATMVVQASWMWADLFVSGALAASAPGVLDGTVADPRLDAGFLLAWFMNATFIVLGIATLRARVFSRSVGWALVAVGVVTLIPLPFDGPVYEVLIGAACIVAGLFARRVPTLVVGRSADEVLHALL
jgi:hypothetical protein